MTSSSERFSALDRFFLDCESESTPMHIGAACRLEAAQNSATALDVQRLRAHVAGRLELIPRYRQRIARVPLEGHPVWIDDDAFDITRHVRAVSLPAPATEAQLDEMLSWIFSQPLPRTRPLWEIWLIQGLTGGELVLACKTHHCMVDGLGAAALLGAILADAPFEQPAGQSAWRARPRPGNLDLFGSALKARLEAASTAASRLAQQAWSEPSQVLAEAGKLASTAGQVLGNAWNPLTTTAFDAPAGAASRLLHWSIPLECVRGIGKHYAATVNDVLLTLVAEGFARCPQLRGAGDSVRAYCPVGAGAHASVVAFGNRVAGMLVDLPVDERRVPSRLQTIAAATRAQKRSGQIEGTLLIENLANALAPSLLATAEWLSSARPVFNLIVTNVPGPSMPLYLFGHRMSAAVPLVPLFRGQGLGIAVFSYGGRLEFGFHVDSGLTSAAAELRDAMATACSALAAGAGVVSRSDSSRGRLDVAA